MRAVEITLSHLIRRLQVTELRKNVSILIFHPIHFWVVISAKKETVLLYLRQPLSEGYTLTSTHLFQVS